MSNVLTIPRLEMSMTEATLAEWLVADGAAVTEGDPLYVLETGKAAQEVAAPSTGVLKRKTEAGGVHLVGAEIGEIV